MSLRDSKDEEEDFESYYYGTMNYYENDLLKIIQREIKNYISNISFPDSTDYAGWLALIQHYGGKTRLLDFTKSFYIALFFAIHFDQEETYSKSTVWAINYFSESISEYEQERKQFDYLSQRFNKIYKNYYQNDRTGNKQIYLLEPIITNKWMIQQEGMFLYGADFESNFLNNLYQCPEQDVKSILDNPIQVNISEYKENIENLANIFTKSRSIKIIIPQETSIFIGVELQAMNINMRQLFPDIYGLIKHYYSK